MLEPNIKEDIDKASQWISRALESSGYLADFSPRSLWEIDRFFEEQSSPGVAKPGGLLSKDLGTRLFALGAYVGEVLRRAKGGEWRGDDADPEVEINVEFHFPDGGRCWPTQRIIKRFKNGAEDGLAVYGLGPGLDVGPKPEQPLGRSSVSVGSWPLWKRLALAFLIGCVLLGLKLLIFKS